MSRLDAADALKRLKEGNARFADGERSDDAMSPTRRAQLAEAQEPFAVVLGCSDSRVPVEVVFDQGLGDLFVIRVIGNVVAPSQLASIEFAAARFGTPLVVVLGHSNCGAIQAAVDELGLPEAERSPSIRSVLDRVSPAVRAVLDAGASGDEVVPRAVAANVDFSVEHIRTGSAIIEGLVTQGGLTIVGAIYSLETGRVEWRA